ncbi:MAG: ribosome biogenesis GTPase Der [Candidatus Omnitrophica bacterium]|nr:ribosome biogenesis GTPase Der [Candidatus Omnitrophota bacterium]MBU4488377.1 ribosome biogenesis GTPase Der [Candidatus Omnitrophota bacterium]MCG2705012.1 ribosome biogenesis GTPase Der [Candidatus Omnitrophota bacterium]
MEKQSIYKICIVGRPNVGKSTLFNRIVGKRQAITEQLAGTTRDRVRAVVNKNGVSFELVDTGGYEIGKKDHLMALVKGQIELAIVKTDAVLFVCDVTSGVMPQDEDILSILRKSGKELILAVNKVDNERLEKEIGGFYNFGIDPVYAVSAIHNLGITELVEKLVVNAHPAEAEYPPGAMKLAVVGRPNVGKSSFINRIINEERVIVHEAPGTTRDSIDIHLEKEGKDFIFIDTAGMRHKRKIKEPVDAHSLLRAEGSINRSDICIVMIDGYEGLMVDDMRIIRLVEESGKGCILLVNKWDTVKNVEMSRYEDALRKRMHYIRSMPVLFTSAKTGLNIDEVFPLMKLVEKNTKAVFSKDELANILNIMQKTERLPLIRSGKLIEIRKLAQESILPQTFSILVNKTAFLPDDYIENVKNILREELGLLGVPIRIKIKRMAGGRKRR